MESIFGSVDKAINESPKEKEENIKKDEAFNPFDFPPFLKPAILGPTGPVEHKHTSLNDFFSNIAKPGAHPKFAQE